MKYFLLEKLLDVIYFKNRFWILELNVKLTSLWMKSIDEKEQLKLATFRGDITISNLTGKILHSALNNSVLLILLNKIVVGVEFSKSNDPVIINQHRHFHNLDTENSYLKVFGKNNNRFLLLSPESRNPFKIFTIENEGLFNFCEHEQDIELSNYLHQIQKKPLMAIVCNRNKYIFAYMLDVYFQPSSIEMFELRDEIFITQSKRTINIDIRTPILTLNFVEYIQKGDIVIFSAMSYNNELEKYYIQTYFFRLDSVMTSGVLEQLKILVEGNGVKRFVRYGDDFYGVNDQSTVVSYRYNF